VFEPSTEVIRKGKASKSNEFGKVLKLQEAENQIVVGTTKCMPDAPTIATC
jgi:transposase, IS5 family